MHRFTEDEAQEILRRAVQAPAGGDNTSEELRRSAAELGISDEALARAEAEVREDRLRREFEAHRRKKTRDEAWQYVSSIAIMAAINLFTSPQYWWFLWVVPWWGMSLVGSFIGSMNRESDGYKRAFEKWRKKRGFTEPSG